MLNIFLTLILIFAFLDSRLCSRNKMNRAIFELRRTSPCVVDKVIKLFNLDREFAPRELKALEIFLWNECN